MRSSGWQESALKRNEYFQAGSLSQFRRIDASDLRELPRHRWETGSSFLSPRIFQPMYRILVLVEAMPDVIARYPKSLLLLTEYAVNTKLFTAQANRRSKSTSLALPRRVRLCGSVTHGTMRDYYSIADVAVSVPRNTMQCRRRY